MEIEQTDASAAGYAMDLANGSYDWYKRAAMRSRKSYKLLEITILLVGATIPASAVILTENAVVPALLGSVVVVLSGSRTIFHWQENYLRFSQAREAVEAERRAYNTGASPYEDKDSRDRILAAAISRIEQEEMRGWVKVAAAQPRE